MNPAFYTLCPYECCLETKDFEVQSVWNTDDDGVAHDKGVFTCSELASSLTRKFGVSSVAALTYEQLFVCTVEEVRDHCQELCIRFLDSCAAPDFDASADRAWASADPDFEVATQLQISASASKLQVNFITEDTNALSVDMHLISENVVDLAAAHIASGDDKNGWNHYVVQVVQGDVTSSCQQAVVVHVNGVAVNVAKTEKIRIPNDPSLDFTDAQYQIGDEHCNAIIFATSKTSEGKIPGVVQYGVEVDGATSGGDVYECESQEGPSCCGFAKSQEVETAKGVYVSEPYGATWDCSGWTCIGEETDIGGSESNDADCARCVTNGYLEVDPSALSSKLVDSAGNSCVNESPGLVGPGRVSLGKRFKTARSGTRISTHHSAPGSLDEFRVWRGSTTSTASFAATLKDTAQPEDASLLAAYWHLDGNLLDSSRQYPFTNGALNFEEGLQRNDYYCAAFGTHVSELCCDSAAAILTGFVVPGGPGAARTRPLLSANATARAALETVCSLDHCSAFVDQVVMRGQLASLCSTQVVRVVPTDGGMLEVFGYQFGGMVKHRLAYTQEVLAITSSSSVLAADFFTDLSFGTSVPIDPSFSYIMAEANRLPMVMVAADSRENPALSSMRVRVQTSQIVYIATPEFVGDNAGDGTFLSPFNADDVTLADVTAKWIDAVGVNDDTTALTVFLYPGVYSGTGWCHQTFVRPIKIIGMSGEKFTQLVCSELDYAIRFVHVSGTSKIKGLSFDSKTGRIDGQESNPAHTFPQGLIIRAMGNLIVDECSFKNNVITSTAHSRLETFSLIYVEAPAHLTIMRSHFADNKGTAIVVNAASAEVVDSTFERNEAEGGSVARGIYNATVSLLRCAVRDCLAGDVGAALDFSSSTLKIHDSEFVGNIGNDHGAVVSAKEFSVVDVTSSTFRENALGCSGRENALGGCYDNGEGALWVDTAGRRQYGKNWGYYEPDYKGSCLLLLDSQLKMDGGTVESNLNSAIVMLHDLNADSTDVRFHTFVTHSTVTNSIFHGNVGYKNNVEGGGGGAIFLTTSVHLAVSKSTFDGNRALPALPVADEMEFLPSEIDEMEFFAYGGALLFMGPSKIDQGMAPEWIVSDCVFTGNHGGNNGGAVDATSGFLTVESSSFVGNDADDGGALWVDTAKEKLQLRSCHFTDNRADTGGAVYVKGVDGFSAEWGTTDNLFERNVANFKGGGLFAMLKATGQFGGNVFAFNEAYSGGGAYLENVKSTVATDNRFEDNKAYEDGGGLMVTLDVEGSVWSGTQFLRNVATTGGGGGAAMKSIDNGHDFHFRNFHFENCTAALRGGGLQVNGMRGQGHFTNGAVSRCTAFNGGGMGFAQSTPLLQQIQYKSCRASEGGTLSFLSAVHDMDVSPAGLKKFSNYLLVAEDLDITDSIAETPGESFKVSKGGAILMILGEGVRMDRVRVSNTRSYKGGALALQSSLLVLHESTVADSDSGVGGAFHLTEAWLAVIGSSITRSFAIADGGGIYSYDSILTMLNTEISNCTARNGAGVFLVESRGSWENVQFSNNGASDRGGAVFASLSTMNVNGGTFDGNTAFGVGGGIGVGGTAYLIDMRPGTTISNSVFTKNTASQGGSLYVETSSLVVNASRFEDNTATVCGSPAPAYFEDNNVIAEQFFPNEGCGGAIYLDNASPGDFLVDIVGSSFSRNTGTWGDGGAMYILQNDHVPSVTLNDTMFDGNTAGFSIKDKVVELGKDWEHFRDVSGTLQSGFGGAIAWTMGVSELTGCVFRNNRAVAAGGAMFWSQGVAPLVCGCGGFTATDCKAEVADGNFGILCETNGGGNEAMYGDFIASTPFFLKVVGNTTLTGEPSGAKFNSAPVVLLQDLYGQTVTTHQDGEIVANVEGTGAIYGTRTANVIDGTATFDNLGIVLTPAANLGIVHSADSEGSTKIVFQSAEFQTADADKITVTTRECIQGEIVPVGENGKGTCFKCKQGTFSTDYPVHPDSTCRPCPNNAVCYGGSEVYPTYGHWSLPGELGQYDRKINQWSTLECVPLASCLGPRELGGTVESKQGTNLLKYEEPLGAYDEVEMSPAQLADLLANSTVTSNTTWTTSSALGFLGVDVPILAEVVIQGNRYTVVAVCYEGTSVATVPIWYQDWDTLDPCDRSRFGEWESALELASMTESLWTVVLADDFQGTTSGNNPLVVHHEDRCNSEDGYQADGNLCFRCQLGHFRTSPTGGCVACPADLYMSYVVFFVGVGIMAVTAIVMIHVTIQASKKKKERLSIMIKVFMSYMQIAGLVAGFDCAWPSAITDLFAAQGGAASQGEALISIECIMREENIISEETPIFVGKVIFFCILPLMAIAVPIVVYSIKYYLTSARIRAMLTWNADNEIFNESEYAMGFVELDLEEIISDEQMRTGAVIDQWFTIFSPVREKPKKSLKQKIMGLFAKKKSKALVTPSSKQHTKRNSLSADGGRSSSFVVAEKLEKCSVKVSPAPESVPDGEEGFADKFTDGLIDVSGGIAGMGGDLLGDAADQAEAISGKLRGKAKGCGDVQLKMKFDKARGILQVM
jgi:hypothetical protein